MSDLLQRLIGLSNRIAMDQRTNTHNTMQLIIMATERIQVLEAELECYREAAEDKDD